MLRAVLTLPMPSWLAGTSSQPPVGTGSVAGRVVDAATGQPMAGATVRLSQTRGGYRSEAYGTDVDGSFSFTGLAPGSFSITASADTYLGGAVGKRRPLGEEVWIALSVDEHRGDDATVVVFPADRTTWPNARIRSRRFQTSRALRGVYDFDTVPAGEYFIAAFDEIMLDPWPSMAFLQRAAASATRVSVKRGVAQVVTLTVTR